MLGVRQTGPGRPGSPWRVLFLCTGNSCRSQMAEGWARALEKDLWQVESAGLEPAGVNPRAVAAMAEAGVDISGQTSKMLDPAAFDRLDLVVTLCGDAEERCPLTPPSVQRLHWGLPDPARATGSEEEIQQVFRRVRDEIRSRLQSLAAQLRATERSG